jgi:cysteinyl-tRNA synthetase
MSKSLGNYFTLRDILGQGYTPEAIRYLLASAPYGKSLNFTFDGLKSASTAIDRLRNFKLRLETDRLPEGQSEVWTGRTAAAQEAFRNALDDDLNTAEALAAVFEFLRDVNTAMDSGEFRAGNAAAALDLLATFDRIFDVLKPPAGAGLWSDTEIEALVAERNAAKKARNFARADEIRAQLSDNGILLEDTKSGVRWKRK